MGPGVLSGKEFAGHENALPLVQHNYRGTIVDAAGLGFAEHICDADVLFRPGFYQPTLDAAAATVLLYPTSPAAAAAAAFRAQRRAPCLPACARTFARRAPAPPPLIAVGPVRETPPLPAALMCAQTPATPKPS